MIQKFGTLSYQYNNEDFSITSQEPSRFFNGGESDETDIILEHWTIKPGDIVIDVGAHIGSWTLPALAMGAEHVYCFEPNKDAIRALHRNLDLNGWRNRVTIIDKALWHKEDKRVLYQVEGTVVDRFNAYCVEDDYTVDCVTLDSYNLRPNWIKIDVEGAELAVLIGGRETLCKNKPKMIIEIHERTIRNIIPNFKYNDISNWLPEYNIKKIQGWHDAPRILAYHK